MSSSDLGDRPGKTTIVTTGFEIATQGVPVERAITGGTGEYAAVVGANSQTFRRCAGSSQSLQLAGSAALSGWMRKSLMAAPVQPARNVLKKAV